MSSDRSYPGLLAVKPHNHLSYLALDVWYEQNRSVPVYLRYPVGIQGAELQSTHRTALFCRTCGVRSLVRAREPHKLKHTNERTAHPPGFSVCTLPCRYCRASN